jgi:hypothetical protein
MAMKNRDSLSKKSAVGHFAAPARLKLPPGKKISNDFERRRLLARHLAVTDASRAESLPGTR